MAKHFVTFHVTASYTAEVDASTMEEAKKKAWDAFDGADFGEVEDVDAEIYCVDDENCKRLFEAD